MVAVQVSRISTATMARGKQNKCKQTQIEKVLLFKKPIEKVGLQINVPGQICRADLGGLHVTQAEMKTLRQAPPAAHELQFD